MEIKMKWSLLNLMIRSSPISGKRKAYREDYWPGLQINECSVILHPNWPSRLVDPRNHWLHKTAHFAEMLTVVRYLRGRSTEQDRRRSSMQDYGQNQIVDEFPWWVVPHSHQPWVQWHEYMAGERKAYQFILAAPTDTGLTEWYLGNGSSM